jgi:hypothetical protein
MVRGMIFGEELCLPGGAPFAIELGESGLPFFDQLQGLPAAPLGSSEHPFRVFSLSGLGIDNGSHGDWRLFFSTFPKSSWVDPFTVRAHFGSSFFDGLLGHAVCDEPAAEFFDSGVLGALGFELGQVLAQTVRDVGADERLVAAKAEGRRDLFEIVDDVIGQAEGDEGHGFVGLHLALDTVSHFHSVSFPPLPQDERR